MADEATATDDTVHQEAPVKKSRKRKSAPKTTRKATRKTTRKVKSAKRPAARKGKAATKSRPSKARVHNSGKLKNRFAINLWVSGPQKKALKSLAKKKKTSIIGMVRTALRLPE